MLNILRIPLFALVVSASLVPKTNDDPERYTVCGYDRGYVSLPLASDQQVRSRLMSLHRRPIIALWIIRNVRLTA